MWIESHQGLARHPKTRRLARALNISVPTAIGHLHLLWWWALDYAQDGNMSNYTNEDIADAACWEGDPLYFTQSLIDAGFIDSDNGYKAIHDWRDYAGKLLERRERDRERKRASLSIPTEIQRKSNGKSMDSECNLTVPNLTVPNLTVTKPDNNSSCLMSEPEPKLGPGSEEYKLAEYLSSRIKVNNPKAKEPNLKTWVKDFDLMIRRDKRDIQDIYALIDYSQADSFWMAIILSPSKLRDKFDQLLIKSRGSPSSVKPNNANDRAVKEWEEANGSLDDIF